MDKVEIEKRIREAFKDIEHPGNEQDDIAVAPWHYAGNDMHLLVGRRWQELDAEFWNSNGLIQDSPCVMTPKCLRYFLPAMLIAVLNNRSLCLSYQLYGVLDPWTMFERKVCQEEFDKFEDKFRVLTLDQKNAVKLFLEYCVDNLDEFSQEYAIAALKHYWEDFKIHI